MALSRFELLATITPQRVKNIPRQALRVKPRRHIPSPANIPANHRHIVNAPFPLAKRHNPKLSKLRRQIRLRKYFKHHPLIVHAKSISADRYPVEPPDLIALSVFARLFLLTLRLTPPSRPFLLLGAVAMAKPYATRRGAMAWPYAPQNPLFVSLNRTP